MLSAELDQARAAAQRAIEDHENARKRAECVERRLAEAESIWREEKETLLVDLEDAKKVVGSKESQKPMGDDGNSPSIRQPSADAAEYSLFKVPERVEHATTAADETCKRRMDDRSDATSQGLAEELLQQLTKENNLRPEYKQVETKVSDSAFARSTRCDVPNTKQNLTHEGYGRSSSVLWLTDSAAVSMCTRGAMYVEMLSRRR